MGKLISIWSFICRRKYLITVVAFAVIIGFLDENSLVRRFGYEREISQLKEEIEKLGKVPYYGTSMSNLASQRAAVNAGFRVAWVELLAEAKI